MSNIITAIERLQSRVAVLETKDVMVGLTTASSPNGVLEGTMGIIALEITGGVLINVWVSYGGTQWKQMRFIA